MSSFDFTVPHSVMERLSAIEVDLAERQNELEVAALDWFRAKRDREREFAERFLAADGTDGQRRAQALEHTATLGAECESRWEALRSVVRVLETRANIGMAILKAHTRA